MLKMYNVKNILKNQKSFISDKQPHVRVPLKLAVDWTLSVSAKSVYLGLASHYPNIFPSISRLEKITGLSRPTVVRAIEELRSRKYIYCVKTDGSVTNYLIKSKK
jgi:DNA-binding MarR family transcriptional regulator